MPCFMVVGAEYINKSNTEHSECNKIQKMQV